MTMNTATGENIGGEIEQTQESEVERLTFNGQSDYTDYESSDESLQIRRKDMGIRREDPRGKLS